MKRATLVLVGVVVAFFAGALGLAIVAASDTRSCNPPLRHFCLPPAITYAALCALVAAIVIVAAALVGISDLLRVRNWAAASMLALLVIDVIVGIYVVPGHVPISGPLMHLASSSWHSLASLTVGVLDVGTLPLALILYCWLDSAPRRAPSWPAWAVLPRSWPVSSWVSRRRRGKCLRRAAHLMIGYTLPTRVQTEAVKWLF